MPLGDPTVSCGPRWSSSLSSSALTLCLATFAQSQSLTGEEATLQKEELTQAATKMALRANNPPKAHLIASPPHLGPAVFLTQAIDQALFSQGDQLL